MGEVVTTIVRGELRLIWNQFLKCTVAKQIEYLFASLFCALCCSMSDETSADGSLSSCRNCCPRAYLIKEGLLNGSLKSNECLRLRPKQQKAVPRTKVVKVSFCVL